MVVPPVSARWQAAHGQSTWAWPTGIFAVSKLREQKVRAEARTRASWRGVTEVTKIENFIGLECVVRHTLWRGVAAKVVGAVCPAKALVSTLQYKGQCRPGGHARGGGWLCSRPYTGSTLPLSWEAALV